MNMKCCTWMCTASLILLLVPFKNLHAQEFGFNIGGGVNEAPNDMAVDSQGNIYIAGNFMSGTIDFDPGPGVEEWSSGGSSLGSAFLASYNSDGEFRYAMSFRDENSIGNSSNILGIDVDSQGNVYVAGVFSDSIDVDPGPGIELLTTNGISTDSFLASYDPNGELRFAFNSNSIAGGEVAYDVSVDGQDNIYVAGLFGDTVDFDPGNGSFELTAPGGVDMYLASYTSEGLFRYAKHIESEGLSSFPVDRPEQLSVDSEGNLCLVGTFVNLVDFDTGPGELILDPGEFGDVFVAKYDNNGDLIYVNHFGDDNVNQTSVGKDVAIDSNGNCNLGGNVWGRVDFDPSADESIIDAGPFNILGFLGSYDPTGELRFLYQVGGTLGDHFVDGVEIDAADNIHLTGLSSSIWDMDPGPGENNFPGLRMVYAIALTSQGQFIDGFAFGGADRDIGKGIATDGQGGLLVSGSFEGFMDIDLRPNRARYLISNGFSDIFVVKYDAFVELPVELHNFQAENLGLGKIKLNWSTATETNNAGFGLEFRTGGDNAWQQIDFIEGKGTSLVENNYEFHLDNQLPGLQQYRLAQLDYDGTIHYSSTVEVDIPIEGNFFIGEVFPHPLSSNGQLSMHFRHSQNIVVKLHNSLGQEIRVLYSDRVESGTDYKLPIDVSGLSSGLYLLRFEGRDLDETRVLVVR